MRKTWRAQAEGWKSCCASAARAPHARPPPCRLRLGPRDEGAAAPVVPKRVAEGLLGRVRRARLYVLSQAAGAAALYPPSSSD
jgi:hypothetical protein